MFSSISDFYLFASYLHIKHWESLNNSQILITIFSAVDTCDSNLPSVALKMKEITVENVSYLVTKLHSFENWVILVSILKNVKLESNFEHKQINSNKEYPTF